MYWAKFDEFRVTEWRNGAVYRTKKIGSRWFRCSDFPPTYTPNPEGVMWVNTTEVHFGSTPPNQET